MLIFVSRKSYDHYNAINAYSRIMKITYPVKGAVSVWVGVFESEGEFDDCVEHVVEPRLGLTTDLDRFSEATFESSPVPVKELLCGFSSESLFIRQALDASNRLGVECANAALVCYNLSCEEVASSWGKLHFLGTFLASKLGG